MENYKTIYILFLVMAIPVSGNLPEVITFKETSYLVEHIATGECMCEQPYYNLMSHQAVSISFLSNIDLHIEWCKLNDVAINYYRTGSLWDPSPASVLPFPDFATGIDISDIGSKSGNLTCKLRYQISDAFETVLPVFCKTQINIYDDEETPKPTSNLLSTYIHAEVSTDLRQPFLVRDVVFYDNSTVEVNCTYQKNEYRHSVKIRDRKGEVIQAAYNESQSIGPFENLNEEFDGTQISCVETDRQANLTYEMALNFVYNNNFTYTEEKILGSNKYENVSDDVIFTTKTNSGEVLSTTECFNEQPTYRVLKGSVFSVLVKSDIKLQSDWCQMNGLKFLPHFSSWYNTDIPIFFLKVYIANIGYMSGELTCRMLYKGKGTGFCKTYIDITDGVSESNDPEIKNNSTLTQALIALDKSNTLKTAELVFRNNTSLVIECDFGGDEYEHSLIFEDNEGNSVLLKKSDAPFVWGPIDDLNITYDSSQFICMDRHKITNVTRETAVKLISINHINTATLATHWIIVIGIATILIILSVLVIAYVLWQKGKCSRPKEPVLSAPRANSVRRDYNYVYEVPYEERIKRDKALEMMKRAAEEPKKRAPPPSATIAGTTYVGERLAYGRPHDVPVNVNTSKIRCNM